MPYKNLSLIYNLFWISVIFYLINSVILFFPSATLSSAILTSKVDGDLAILLTILPVGLSLFGLVFSKINQKVALVVAGFVCVYSLVFYAIAVIGRLRFFVAEKYPLVEIFKTDLDFVLGTIISLFAVSVVRYLVKELEL